MGACDFYTYGEGKNAAEAFKAAVDQALYDHGHSGYSGTLAEKTDFVEIPLPKGRDAMEYAEELMDEDDVRITDKWGPAGCLKVKKGRYLFFGWASS